MRKTLSIVLTAVLLLSTISLAGLSVSAETLNGTCGDGVNWTLDTATGALTISGTGAMYDNEEFIVPWFNYISAIKTVTVQDGVTSVANFALLNGTSLTSVTLGKDVKAIGNSAFEGCTALTSVSIPEGVESIGSYAFRACTALKGINVAESNAKYCSENGILYNKDKTALVQYPAGKADTSYDIPDGVKSIADHALSYTAALESVTIPASVENVYSYAFAECSSLESVEIGENVKSIPYAAFENCASLTSIVVPDSAESIEDNAFKGCSSLKNVTVSSSVKTIGSNAFIGCTSLGAVIMESEAIAAALTGETSAGRLLNYAQAIAFGDTATTVTAYVKKVLKFNEKIDYNGTKYNVYSDHSHGWQVYTVPAENCGDMGFNGHKCSKCGLLKGAEVTTDHTYDDDCDADCNVCGEVREAPHSYELNSDSDGHWHECALCGDKKDEGEHVYDDDKDGECNVCGYERFAYILGDVNGDGEVDNADAAIILKYDAGIIDLDDTQMAAADVNGDGLVDNADAAMILKYDAGIISEF